MRKTMFIFFIGLALIIGFYGNVHAYGDPSQLFSTTRTKLRHLLSCQ